MQQRCDAKASLLILPARAGRKQGPFLDLDAGDKRRPTLAVWTLAVRTEDQRLAIRQTGRPLGKRAGDIGEVSDQDRVRPCRKVGHLLLQPRGLSNRPTLHALAVVA